MIVVVILGILAAIAIPLYMKFVQQSKTSEAHYNLGTIVRHIEQFYARSTSWSTNPAITPGPIDTAQARFPLAADCGTIGATGFLANGEQVPPTADLIQAKKYQPTGTDWQGTWTDLHFVISHPIMYGYCYEGAGTGSASKFTVFAFGDLDGDNTWSQYARIGIVVDGRPTIGPVAVFNEDE